MIIAVDIFKFILFVFVTFFACQVVTGEKKRISYIGTLLICFSSAIVEYIDSGLLEAVLCGELILISVDKLLEDTKYKYLYSIAIPVGLLGFIKLSNISFQISIGIVFITLIIWRLMENRKKIDDNKKGYKIVLIFGVLLAILLGSIFYEYQSINALEKKSGLAYITSYTYDSFRVFDRNIKYEELSCLSTFISVFPIGLIMGIWYIFKEETKHLKFIIPTIIISILELLLIVSNKAISFLPNYIIILGFNLLQIYIIIYFFGRIEEGLFNLTKSAYVALLGLLILMFMPMTNKLNKILQNLSYVLFVLEAYIILNYSDRRFWRLSSWVFTIICLFDFIGDIIVNFV